ncbi:hypothetical protein C8R44DRAFT_890068 [Mycena epipterygia]|nr:hypothetical protein C8R44DRAFT_890068 [Mycena epipterygia]
MTYKDTDAGVGCTDERAKSRVLYPRSREVVSEHSASSNLSSVHMVEPRASARAVLALIRWRPRVPHLSVHAWPWWSRLAANLPQTNGVGRISVFMASLSASLFGPVVAGAFSSDASSVFAGSSFVLGFRDSFPRVLFRNQPPVIPSGFPIPLFSIRHFVGFLERNGPLHQLLKTRILGTQPFPAT